MALRPRRLLLAAALLLAILPLAACRRGSQSQKQYGYISARQASLRDRVAMVYNKVATVHNGDRVQILEDKRRFLRVRTEQGEEGWIEERYVAGQDVYDGLQRLVRENAKDPPQSTATARASLNMHVEPSRTSPAIYQLKEADKVEVLKRAVAEKQAPGAAPPRKAEDVQTRQEEQQKEQEEDAVVAAKGKKDEPPATGKPVKKAAAIAPPPNTPPPSFEDWWLVRDSAGRYGWVLGRMLDIDVPIDVAQYAEGQRIVAGFVLDRVKDEESGKDIPEYLVLLTDPKDGLPYDFNQVRVFTWNRKRSRYETAYRDRLQGQLPVLVGREDFGKEGVLPTFTVRALGGEGKVVARKYKLNTPMVRPVLAPGEQPVRFASPSHEQQQARSRVARRKTRH